MYQFEKDGVNFSLLLDLEKENSKRVSPIVVNVEYQGCAIDFDTSIQFTQEQWEIMCAEVHQEAKTFPQEHEYATSVYATVEELALELMEANSFSLQNLRTEVEKQELGTFK